MDEHQVPALPQAVTNILKTNLCGKCKHSRRVIGPQGPALQCRRNPPTSTAIIVPMQRPDGKVEPQVVTHTDWPHIPMDETGCGEWVQKILLD